MVGNRMRRWTVDRHGRDALRLSEAAVPEPARGEVRVAVRAVDRIGLKPVIDRRYPFAALPAALDHQVRGASGKIVVHVTTGD